MQDQVEVARGGQIPSPPTIFNPTVGEDGTSGLGGGGGGAGGSGYIRNGGGAGGGGM